MTTFSAPSPDAQDAPNAGAIDADLVARTLRGESDAFAQLFDRYAPRVYAVARYIVGDRADVEDITQDTFLQALSALETLRRPEAFGAWIARIATNVAMSSLRRRQQKPQAELTEVVANTYPDTTRWTAPEPATLAVEEQRLVRLTLDRLSPSYRRALTLREMGGLSYSEIASALGTTNGSVETLLFRARTRFRDEYNKVALGAGTTATTATTVTCPRTRAILAALADLEAAEPERITAQSHVAQCVTCAAALKAQQETRRRLLVLPWIVPAAVKSATLAKAGLLLASRSATVGAAAGGTAAAVSGTGSTTAVGGGASSAAAGATTAGAGATIAGAAAPLALPLGLSLPGAILIAGVVTVVTVTGAVVASSILRARHHQPPRLAAVQGLRQAPQVAGRRLVLIGPPAGGSRVAAGTAVPQASPIGSPRVSATTVATRRRRPHHQGHAIKAPARKAAPTVAFTGQPSVGSGISSAPPGNPAPFTATPLGTYAGPTLTPVSIASATPGGAATGTGGNAAPPHAVHHRRHAQTRSRAAPAVATATRPAVVVQMTATGTPIVTPTSTPSASATQQRVLDSAAQAALAPLILAPAPTSTPTMRPDVSALGSTTNGLETQDTATPTPAPPDTATATTTVTPSTTVDTQKIAVSTATSTATPTDTLTETATLTATATVIVTPTARDTATPTPTDTPSAGATPTATRAAIVANVVRATATATPTTVTSTPTATDTATATVTAISSDTATPTATPSPSSTPTDTPTDTATSTATPTPSDTATGTATATDSPTATGTDSPTATTTPTATATATLPPPATATATPTITPSSTSTVAPSNTPSATATSTSTATGTSSPTATPTSTMTATLTSTPTTTGTATPTATPTSTSTATPTGTATATPSSTPTANGCPAAWSCADVGQPRLAGGQAIAGDTWTVWGAGRDIWWRMDQFHFIAQPVGATASLSAQVLAQTRTHPWAKVGLMLRDSSSAGAPYVDILVTPNRGIVVQYRLRPFAWAWQKGWLLLGKAPVYLRLTRNGDVVSAAVSRDGRAWVTITVMTVPLQPTALLGVAITSHQPDALSIATLRGVTLTS